MRPESTMPLTADRLRPNPGLPVPSTYTHVVVAAGTKMVFIAGQEPAGARPGQVAKITIYVVHYAIAVTDR